MQDTTGNAEDETEMITSEGGSEDQDIDEILASEGLDLVAIAESWRTNGIDKAPKEVIQKVSELFIARQRAEIEKQNRKLGIVKGSNPHLTGVIKNIPIGKQKRKKGRRTSGEALQVAGEILLNSGKIKPLTEYLTFQHPV